MNRIKQIIELEAPGCVQQRPLEMQQLLSCNACKGRGYHVVERYKNHFFNDPCKVCGGSGHVIAQISISFIPFK